LSYRKEQESTTDEEREKQKQRERERNIDELEIQIFIILDEYFFAIFFSFSIVIFKQAANFMVSPITRREYFVHVILSIVPLPPLDR
jgi:heme/copper-type cytochrome/quinol oxidase subunit 3